MSDRLISRLVRIRAWSLTAEYDDVPKSSTVNSDFRPDVFLSKTTRCDPASASQLFGGGNSRVFSPSRGHITSLSKKKVFCWREVWCFGEGLCFIGFVVNITFPWLYRCIVLLSSWSPLSLLTILQLGLRQAEHYWWHWKEVMVRWWSFRALD